MINSQSNIFISSTIPIIDLKASSNEFDRILEEAFKTVGFVGIVNTGIESNLVENVYQVFRRFFSQARKIKEEISDPTNCGERGYVASSESPLGKDINFKDNKEFVHFGPELSSTQQKKLGYPKNLWPRSIDVKKPTTKFYKKLSEFVLPLASSMERILGASPCHLQKMLKKGDHLFRVVSYESTGLEGAAPHTDSNFITLLPPATSKGLEVLIDNKWVPIVVPDGAMIVNVGSMAEHWSNGYFKAAYHRVVTEANASTRISIAFFVHSRENDSMEPLKNTIDLTGGKQFFPPATRQELLDRRLIEMGRATEDKIIRFSKTGLIERYLQGSYASPQELEKIIKILIEKKLASQTIKKAYAMLNSR